MHGSVIGLLIEGEHICIAAPLHILVVWSQKLWKGYVALKRTHNAISKSKKLRHNTHTHTRGTNDINFLLPSGWILKNICHHLFSTPFELSAKNEKLAAYLLLLPHFLFIFSLSLSPPIFAFCVFSVSHFSLYDSFFTLFDCHICSLAVPLLSHWCRFFSFFLFRMFGTKGIFFAWLTCILNINA